MSETTKLKNSKPAVHSKSRSTIKSSHTSIENHRNSLPKLKMSKQGSVPENSKLEHREVFQKDLKKNQVEQTLSKTIETNSNSIIEDVFEKVMGKINKLKNLIQAPNNPPSRDFSKTKKFLNTYMGEYTLIEEGKKFKILDEIVTSSNKRHEKYENLLTDLKLNFNLLSEIIQDENFKLNVESMETNDQEYDDEKDNKKTIEKSKIRSNSIVEGSLNSEYLSKIGKTTPLNKNSSTANKKRLNSNRSIIFESSLKNLNMIIPNPPTKNSKASDKSLKKVASKMKMNTTFKQKLPSIITAVETINEETHKNNNMEVQNLSIHLIKSKGKESLNTSRNYAVDEGESKIGLRLTPKETNYKANDLSMKNKFNMELFKSQITDADESFQFHIPSKSKNHFKPNKKSAQKLIFKSSVVIDDNAEYRKPKMNLKSSFIHARTELDSMRINTKLSSMIVQNDNLENEYNEEALLYPLEDVDEENVVMNTSVSKPSCCLLF